MCIPMDLLYHHAQNNVTTALSCPGSVSRASVRVPLLHCLSVSASLTGRASPFTYLYFICSMFHIPCVGHPCTAGIHSAAPRPTVSLQKELARRTVRMDMHRLSLSTCTIKCSMHLCSQVLAFTLPSLTPILYHVAAAVLERIIN